MANHRSTSVGEPVHETKSSRCVTITESTATLNFEVTNYPEVQFMGVGEYVQSALFRAGGYDWGILFYPNGSDHRCAGYSSAYVSYQSQIDDVSVKYTLSVQGREGQAPVASCGPREQVFSPADLHTVGYPLFVEKSKLTSLSRSRLGHGGFTIRCVLTLKAESTPLELPGHLERWLADGTGADVTFGVGGREFRAHRSHLAARSPVFRAQFFGSMTEKESDMPSARVEVVDVEPTIFQMLLHYIYTDSLPPCEDEGGYDVAVMQHLMVAADRYMLDRLRLMCEEHLCEKIDMDTVITMFALANQHDCKHLKGACLVFMASPDVLGAILETDGIKECFMTNCGPLPLEWGSASRTKRSRREEEEADPSSRYFKRISKK